MSLCRLCGDKKSPLDLIVELADQTSSGWSYRELIEHHTRVSLKTSKLLPQSICEECRMQLVGFAEFTSKLQLVQQNLECIEVDEPEAPDCLIVMDALEESDGGEVETLLTDDSDDWEEPVKTKSKVKFRCSMPHNQV